jgi:hypothetical protein
MNTLDISVSLSLSISLSLLINGERLHFILSSVDYEVGSSHLFSSTSFSFPSISLLISISLFNKKFKNNHERESEWDWEEGERFKWEWKRGSKSVNYTWDDTFSFIWSLRYRWQTRSTCSIQQQICLFQKKCLK